MKNQMDRDPELDGASQGLVGQPARPIVSTKTAVIVASIVAATTAFCVHPTKFLAFVGATYEAVGGTLENAFVVLVLLIFVWLSGPPEGRTF